MTAPTPAGWYPDPSGAGGLRWWDGNQWTEHVHAGEAESSGPQAQAAYASAEQAPYQQQYAAGQQAGYGQAGGAAGQPPGGYGQAQGRSPLTEQQLFVSQQRKLIELTNEYLVYAADGTQVGAVAETNQSGLKKAARFLTSLDQYMTHTVEVRDAYGQPLLVLTRPAKVFKSTMVVTRPDGYEIGRLVQRNMIGKIRFGLESGGAEIGSLNAENWRAWNFAILDHTGTEIARITKKWEGLLTTVFTTADNYLVDIHRPLADPMHSLVIASALTVDTALKQDSRGFG